MLSHPNLFLALVVVVAAVPERYAEGGAFGRNLVTAWGKVSRTTNEAMHVRVNRKKMRRCRHLALIGRLLEMLLWSATTYTEDVEQVWTRCGAVRAARAVGVDLPLFFNFFYFSLDPIRCRARDTFGF